MSCGSVLTHHVCLCLCLHAQWLQSIIRLHADINKFLSSTTDSVASSPLPAKPIASVMPQVQTQPAIMTPEPAAVASETTAPEIPAVLEAAMETPVALEIAASEIQAAMEATESDEAETTLSADNSEVNISLEILSRDSPEDKNMSDVEPRSCSIGVEALAAHHCESNGCNSVDDSVQKSNLSSSADGCCCNSNNDITARTQSSWCSEYEAASVLSDMQQLATLAAFSPALSTSFSAVDSCVNTVSDTRSTSIKTADCVSALPLPLSSNVTGRSLSG